MYSQFGQDDVILKIFENITDGYFLDIGAHSRGEDTLRLEELGWSGICVEPLDEMFDELSSKRKCQCRNVCIGDKNGTVNFLHNTGYTAALSGVVDYYCEQHKKRIESENFQMGGSSKIIVKEMKTLTSLLDEENAPKHIQLLKIDIEGGEYAALSGIDFSKYSFDLITLEANYQDEIDKCSKLLNGVGYEFLCTVGIDQFFRRIHE